MHALLERPMSAARLWAWLLLPVLLVVGMWVRAQSQPMRWEFCGYNSDMSPTTQCFDSLEKAETWIRTEPASGPVGRKRLQQVGMLPYDAFVRTDPYVYEYAIKSLPPERILPDEYATIAE